MDTDQQAIADLLVSNGGKATWEECVAVVDPKRRPRMFDILKAMERAGTARRVTRWNADQRRTEFYVTNTPKPEDGIEV